MDICINLGEDSGYGGGISKGKRKGQEKGKGGYYAAMRCWGLQVH